MYLSAILLYLTWPVLIFVSWFLVNYTRKRFERRWQEPAADQPEK